MKCQLVFDDWREAGRVGSISRTELGVALSAGDLHSGSTFEAEITLDEEHERELLAAWREHGAYAVFRVFPEEKKGEAMSDERFGAWQPIETAPKDGREILVSEARGIMWLAYWDTLRGSWESDIGEMAIEEASGPLTWWLPIPPQPKAEGQP